jgi:hypothetical protein
VAGQEHPLIHGGGMAPACNSRCPSHQSHVARSRTHPACPEGPRGSAGILPWRRTRWSTMAAGSLLFLPLSALVAPRSYDERPTRMMRGVAGLSFILPWRISGREQRILRIPYGVCCASSEDPNGVAEIAPRFVAFTRRG